MKKKLLISCMFLTGSIYAQNYEKLFLGHVEKLDTMGQRLVLAEWVSQ
ncbi:MAG: hypothetical protein RL160_451, partial [Bacteroidota bacterium]